MTEKPHIAYHAGRWLVFPYHRGGGVCYSYSTAMHAFTAARYFWDFRRRWKMEKSGRGT